MFAIFVKRDSNQNLSAGTGVRVSFVALGWIRDDASLYCFGIIHLIYCLSMIEQRPAGVIYLSGRAVIPEG